MGDASMIILVLKTAIIGILSLHYKFAEQLNHLHRDISQF